MLNFSVTLYLLSITFSISHYIYITYHIFFITLHTQIISFSLSYLLSITFFLSHHICNTHKISLITLYPQIILFSISYHTIAIIHQIFPISSYLLHISHFPHNIISTYHPRFTYHIYYICHFVHRTY